MMQVASLYTPAYLKRKEDAYGKPLERGKAVTETILARVVRDADPDTGRFLRD
jgi:hypothetical protein